MESDFEGKLKQEFKKVEKDYDGLEKFMKNIEQNANTLIALGKEVWLKKRKSQHKSKMTDEQQEGALAEIEIEKDNEYPDV